MSYSCKLCGNVDSRVLAADIRDWEYGVEGSYSFVECTSCQQIQLSPFPTLADLKNAYPDHYPAYLANVKKQKGALYKVLERLHNALSVRGIKPYIRPGSKVLDVGMGNGDFLLTLEQLGASELHGIDFNPHACAIAKGKGIHPFEGVFMDYPAEEESFDVVAMNNYIEHVLNPVDELNKAYRILKKGGLLFGTLPNFNGLDRAIAGRYWGGNHVPRHTFQFTDALLAKHLRHAAFAEIEIVQDINTGHVAISVQNWLQREVKDLRDNPNLSHGRMRGFNLLLLSLLPLNLVFAKLFRRSGTITFYATKR